MNSKMEVPELRCMDPENYRKCFRALCWSGTRKLEKPYKRRGKKDRLRRPRSVNPLAVCYAPALLANPSQFSVYATVRKSILARWRHLYGAPSENSDDSDTEESYPQLTHIKVPKVTGLGLRTVFELLGNERYHNVQLCENALTAMLDILQGFAPEELAQESPEIMSHLRKILKEYAQDERADPRLIALGVSCLASLAVAKGEVELILDAVATLIVVDKKELATQLVKIPLNVVTLQRSVHSVILGPPSRNRWLNYGVPLQSLVTSFPVDLPSELAAWSGDLIVRALVSDGCYLFVYTSRGLLKIGSGYGSSIKQHVYMYDPYFFPSERHGWLGVCNDKLYLRQGRKSTEICVLDKDAFTVLNLLKLDPGKPAPIEPKIAVFTDGHQLGMVMLTNYNNLTIRLYDVEKIPERLPDVAVVKSRKELTVPLMRRRTLVFGRATFEDGIARRGLDSESPAAMQLDENEDDPLVGICGGQDFGLLTTASGKVYYTGKGSSLGFKLAPPYSGRWTMIKETLFNKNDTPNMKKFKVVQVAVGHEGVHAIFVLDNGTALFTGIARRGEDGDNSKHRRAPKPTKPKKIFRAEGHHVVYAACNYGSTALVTRQGVLLMFGKDTQHCDSNGVVQGLKGEKVVQVALGKAHAVVLTSLGLVYTLGINNKGQCGREFGYTKEKHYLRPQAGDESKEVRICHDGHTWITDYCRVCVQCRECTGFAGACHLSTIPDRVPGDKCGCGEGDSGCSECGICRQCAEQARSERDGDHAPTDDEDTSGREDSKFENKEGSKYEGQAGSDIERDASRKVSCLPPAKIAIPGGHKAISVACGLHHTVLLTESGEVLTFGSNQYGQLGAGDVAVHHRIIRVRSPKILAVSAGSNHTVLLTKEGELYTFGNHQKGALGRPQVEESDDAPDGERRVWYATPDCVPNLGPRHACKATWLSASGDQTFVQISQALIKIDSLFSATIIANNNSILILPNQPEHTFKCITINKNDGSCNTWTGPEQVDFVNTLACLDHHYEVLWCYQPLMRVMQCYNILAFDSHKLQRCCNPDLDYAESTEYFYPNVGAMRRLEEFKNMENFEVVCNNEEKPVDSVALSNISILNQELAIPVTHGSQINRMHVALHLLGCLDSLTYAHDNKLNMIECKREAIASPVAPLKADYLTVTRFQNHGGGWGYSGHSVEAIRFMCDTDILLGGYGLFGGRGDYTAKIKLFDIGNDGGDQEGDGELITESEEVVYECAPRDRFPVMFDSPIPIPANRWYVAWACVNGPSSDCGSAGQAMIINDDVGFHFKTSKRSNNGTDVNAGQIPSLIYNVAGTDHAVPTRVVDHGEPVITLTKNISRKVTVACFKTLLLILNFCWDTLHYTLFDTNGLVPLNFWKLAEMKKQKRLVYVIRASLRLAKSYIHEIYPQNNKKRNPHEYMHYFESIGEIKLLIQSLLGYETPTCAMLEDHPARARKTMNSRVCYVQFSLELTNSILKESQETFTACFYAFCPTPSLKWDHFVALLHNVKNGKVPPGDIRELTATCAAMCSSRSLRDVLQYIVPITQNSMLSEQPKPDTKVMSVKDVPSKSATVPRVYHGSKPPPIPPRASQKDNQKPSTSKKQADSEWHLLDVVRCLLDIVMVPIKEQMMTRQRGLPHDHGEIKLHEQLANYCCKLTVRIIAELSYSASNIRDMESTTMKQLVTPSRFMRMNQSRSWNTGNGSPDAICFTVDRPGVTLVGVSVYTGTGKYEYTLELLHDMRQLHGTAEDANPANCWVSIDTVSGSFNGSDCQQDMAQLKFDKPIPLKEDLRYALRLCNHGGRTANGDCGLPSVKGNDGTTFRFASCSLSFNGTTLARGQIPCFIYYASQSRPFVHSTDSADAMIASLRAITLRVSSFILERTVELFYKLKNELTVEDLRRNVSVLQQSPAVNILLPYCLANLDGMDNLKGIIKLLELIHKLLPHVSAMNSLVPTVEEFTTTTTNYYAWVESEHPYFQANVTNKRVLFPPNVSWIVLELDPRSVTAQPEDTLTIYAVAGTPKQRCHCQNEVRVADPPFRKVYKRLVTFSQDGELEEMAEEPDENTCMHYNCTYVSVTPKLANVASDWPQNALLVPGNEVIFSLETATDYLTDYNKTTTSDENRFGFRCLCAGYEDTPLTSQRQGLVALEMELVHAGASYASKLLAPDLDMPPMVFSTLVDVQLKPYSGSEGEDQDQSEALLLSRGLELSSPLSVHQVLDGQSLLRCVSTERQFLIDFIAGAESTAGGRLARWLAPTPQVEPAKCEIKGPPLVAHPNSKLTLPVLVKDQYGDSVACSSLKVEVVVQKLDDPSCRLSRACSSDAYRIIVPDQPYQPAMKDTMRFNSITMMKGYQGFSFEELRLASGAWGDAVTAINSRIPAERLVVRPQSDGCYVVTWTPKVAGVYAFRCTIDDLPISQELLVDVTDNLTEVSFECGVQTAQSSSPPIKIRRFNLEHSAGLRIRASPSLQAEELGRVAPGQNVAFVEEMTNKDGTWVRLSACSLATFTDGAAPVAWCLAHHCQLDRTLLELIDERSPIDEQKMIEFPGLCTEYDENLDGMVSPPPPPAPAPSLPPEAIANNADNVAGPSCSGPINKSHATFASRRDFVEDVSDEFGFPPEPSKRDRQLRNEAGVGRRSNGNEWWEPVRHRPDSGPEVDDDIHEDEVEMVDAIPMSSTARRLYSAMCENKKSGVSQDVVPHGYYRPILHEPIRPLRRPPCLQPDSPNPEKSPVLHEIPGHKRESPPNRDEPPELQPKMKNRDPGPSRHLDEKPPVLRDQKPELPFRERPVPSSPRLQPKDSGPKDHGSKDFGSIGPKDNDSKDPKAHGSKDSDSIGPKDHGSKDFGPKEHVSKEFDPKDHDPKDAGSREALPRLEKKPDPQAYRDMKKPEPAKPQAEPAGTVAVCTQTSPDTTRNVRDFYLNLAKEVSSSPRGQVKERVTATRALKRSYTSPPPLPARAAPAPPPPKKHALSPAQAECLRAIFAALLWHEGIVHDAIACAAFLKFHPQLPKQGARVVTRPPHDVTPTRHQRHSVEVSNAGHYLRIHPSTLESLTRSGVEASASRARKSELVDAIREEDGHANIHEPGPSCTPSVVSVLPPALRALVALWDALYDSDQLSAATDKYKKPIEEVKEVDEPKVVSDTKLLRGAIPKKVEWKAGFISYKAPYAVRCELCAGASVPPPLAAHMRHLHPGCRAPSQRGYDRAGIYKRAEPPPTPAPTDMPPSTCGQLAQDMSPASSLWYVYCERCRDKTLKAASAKQTKGKASLNSNDGGDTTSTVDHHVMKENAVFLLDLAPLTNSESISTSPWYEGPGRGPPTPPGSVWQPAPPFQCLPALGAAPRASATVDAARYHSLGRPPPPPVAPLISQYGVSEATHHPRVHRSVSMGQAGGRDLANAARPPLTNIVREDDHDTLSGAGSSLLAQPSAELQRLVGCGDASNAAVSAFEPPRVDPDALMKSPVLSFVLAKRDLPVYRQKMDAAVRINTVRQYAFEAMNWLLRSTTQPTCVHDVMWWFCTALDKYARLVPPPSINDDNKENVANEVNRLTTPTASTAVICPGGRAARGARAAFHAFLGSVSALAPSLSPASAASLQAVRCWALHYSQEDRAFLHRQSPLFLLHPRSRSQVFNVISKILSHSEDMAYGDEIIGAIHESLQSFLNKEHYVWTCPDVTGWCDLSVSSRAGMAGSLIDGSTETFWESGDEDRNKAKWIQVAFTGGSVEDRPSIVCVHVDNTRDTVNKTLLVSFLYSGSSGEMFHMHDMEVDPKVATWVCYTLPTCYPGANSGSLRVRCELRGPEPAVRVRQLRVLGVPAPLAKPSPSPARILHVMAEADTLRVFRLLTSEVFGKLLEWERSGSESGEGPMDDAPADDSDLREHVVGILFAGHQLTSLQREVMTHIVSAIGAEAARVRDDWETALLCAEAAERADQISLRPVVHQQDNYCFEMLSLLLALSGSQVGRSLLAQQTDLLADLLALLHTGSERVQRQVISLLRRIISEIPPQKMLAAINPGSEISERITLLDHLLCYLGKAITVQMKVKGTGGSAPGSMTLGSSVIQGPSATWFMRGETTKKHAHLVAKLLFDMAEEKVSPTWGLETRTALASYAAQVAQINETDRRPDRCVTLPTMWMSLAALCVCEQAHIELLNGAEGREARARDSSVEPRTCCVNHDDGTTTAVIECRTCGALCAECDRFLHLNRATKAHHRQICKEEESAIRIDIHEGCGRAKLFWLLLLVDRRTLKGLAEFRGMDTGVREGTSEPAAVSGSTGLAGICRFCGARGNSGLLAIGNVCADHQCQEHGAQACNRLLSCGHLCGGVHGERTCLPCLLGCSGDPTLRQDADDMCMICFTDPLQAAPAIQLGCGHVFHLHCCKKVLSSKWIGPRITFSFAQCPICKDDMGHWTLSDLLLPINRLREEVQRKALMRLEYEGLAASGSAGAHFDPAKYAMERYAYYVCHKCEKAYFGGLARCEAESNGVWEPSELVCGACSDVASAKTCPKHGADFLEYKCRYCCSVAVFFCFGTSHFCNACHDDFQRVTNIPRHLLPQCPAGPKGEQLPGSADECPLHVVHPPTGEEFALGCGVCRHAHVF